ncbi:hypothetical protein M0812_11292 [Anaeramoeba flamelloides]|uniref:Photosystem I assembly protein Ycf4 n=1 Tax=Anaeramoeba flamelloides TaxID=1746091 RepID=A0AAV7ZTT1_9EUKA|nr:hypothetical protein M0812_11292 [Anaeramoeba flamelloides]
MDQNQETEIIDSSTNKNKCFYFLVIQLILTIICVLKFFNLAKKLESLSQEFSRLGENSDHLLSELSPKFVEFARSKLGVTEQIKLQTIPTASKLNFESTKALFYGSNISTIILNFVIYFYFSYVEKDPMLSIFVVVFLVNAVATAFCFCFVDLKFTTLYILTDENVYLFGNYRQELKIKIPFEYRKWKLDELSDIKRINRANNTGDLIFATEIPNTVQRNFPQPIGFKSLENIQEIEDLLQKQIDLFLINKSSLNKTEREKSEKENYEDLLQEKEEN